MFKKNRDSWEKQVRFDELAKEWMDVAEKKIADIEQEIKEIKIKEAILDGIFLVLMSDSSSEKPKKKSKKK